MNGFHGTFATGVACQQGMLTLPDIWFRPPLLDLLVLQLLRPDSSNLPCLYSTFHIEYPLVLSRFCFHVPRFLYVTTNWKNEKKPLPLFCINVLFFQKVHVQNVFACSLHYARPFTYYMCMHVTGTISENIYVIWVKM